MIGRAAPRGFPTSGHLQKASRAIFHDLTCLITHDRTHDRVRSSLPQLPAPRQRTSSVTGRRPYVSGHFHCAAFGHGPDRARARQLHYKWPDAQQVSPVTSGLEFGRSKTPPFDLQLRHPWSNVPTTKCFTLCTCVSIFSQTFSRVLALTRI
jgi:hypothetical protein